MDRTKYMAKKDKTIEEHRRDLLSALVMLWELGYIKDLHLYKLAEAACNHHDDGKANTEFQKRILSEKKISFQNDREVIHNVLSLFFINPQEFEPEDYYKVAHAVLNHHNYGDALQLLDKEKSKIEKLVKNFQTYALEMTTKKRLAGIVNDKEAILVKGLLHKCDYSASAGYQVEYANDFLEDSLEQLKEKWREKNPNADWNDLQRFCMAHKDKNVIAIAQTGMGKTEAGLHWIGNNKGFFILPLRTAINAIYDRVRKDIVGEQDIEVKAAVLHSEALEYYLKNIKEEDIDVLEYYQKGKQMSIPLSVSTLDQLFDFVFKYQGFELKLTTLAYAKVVIDEIQMYSPELLAFLIYGIREIVRLGGKVAIVTATLPPFIRDMLVNIFPDEELAQGVFTDDSIRHYLEVRDSFINATDIWEKYHENEEQNRSNKLLIVCNTIQKAQDIYQQLIEFNKNNKEKVPIYILHSRFIRKERSDKEKEIIRFGKTFDKDGAVDKKSGIWISTSLVEASLDIDFDYLFTELQDLTSLFQRLGRCNRKGVKNIVGNNCFVYTRIEEKLLSISNKGFIDALLFNLSKEAISSINGPISEYQKLSLIEQYLTTENLKGSNYMEEYEAQYEIIENIRPYQFQPKEERLRNIFTEAIIPSDIYEEFQEEILECEYYLTKRKLKPIEKASWREKILQYTTNVSLWHVKAYRKAIKDKALSFPKIKLGKYEEIQVMECIYDEMGFRPMHYAEVIRDANFV